MDANLFMVQYSAISAALVEAGALTLYDRLNGFIDRLPSGILNKVSDCAAEENWKLLASDVGGNPVNFETLKSHVDVLICGEWKRKIFEQERVSRIDWSFSVKKPP